MFGISGLLGTLLLCHSCNCLSYFLCCCLCSILFCCGLIWFASCLACICNLFLLYFCLVFYVVCSWVGSMCLAGWGIVYQRLMLRVCCMADWTMWCFFFFCFSVCCFGCYCLWVLVCTLICSYIHFFWGRLGKVGLPFWICKICKIFEENKLNITIEANKKIIDFLDITMDLRTGVHKPFMKPNTPLYVHNKSNHPPNIIKNIPESINRRLSNISSNEKIFKKAIPPYQDALKKSELKFWCHNGIFWWGGNMWAGRAIHAFTARKVRNKHWTIQRWWLSNM